MIAFPRFFVDRFTNSSTVGRVASLLDANLTGAICMRLSTTLSALVLTAIPLTSQAITIDFEGIVTDTGTQEVSTLTQSGFQIRPVGSSARAQIRGKDAGDPVPGFALATTGSAILFALGPTAAIEIFRADGGLFDLSSVLVSEGYADPNADSGELYFSATYADRSTVARIIALDGFNAAGDPASYQTLTLGADFRNVESVLINGLARSGGTTFAIDDIVVSEAMTPIPLPATGWVLLSGGALLSALRRKSKA